MKGLEPRRKRALYRANHRGTKELDLMLGRFANACVPTMDEERLTAFERLLVLPDPEIDRWVRKGKAPDGVAAIIGELRAFLGFND
ncbi:MAG TPA: succinate dehydrogenase assembly factor 2 [Hyphomicrobiales bacterium]|nr:succinate dehydrogenase assembly factor 2 [Hyphomicrobiales bacterium]